MQQPAAIWALTLALCFGPSVLAIYMPVVPMVQAEFDVPRQVAQLSLSIPLVAVLAAPLLAGLLVDRIGRKRVMVLSALIAGFGCLLSAVTSDYGLFLFGRIIAGLFSSLCLVVARAVISDIFESGELAKKLARYTLAPIVAMMIAPMLGALMMDYLGWREVFVQLAVFAAVTFVLIIFGLPETLSVERDDNITTQLTRLFSNAPLWGYVLQSAVHYGVAIGFCSAAAYIMADELALPAWQYSLGLIFVLVGLGAGVRLYEVAFSGYLHARAVFAASLGTLVLAIVLYGTLAVAGSALSGLILFLPAIVMSVGIGLALPPSQAGILLAVPDQAGGASGLSSALQMVSAALFVHLMTLNEPSVYAVLPFYVIAALAAACLACGLFLIRSQSTPDAS